MKDLEKQVQQLQDNIFKTYSHMNRHPYTLHAICVHDGNAESGHYYTFIHDHFGKKWRKFNDIRVTEVAEELVFKESMGGDDKKTAYWLVYVSEKTRAELEKTNVYLFDTQISENDNKTHVYAKSFPTELLASISAANAKNRQEYQDYFDNENVKQVTALYDARYNELVRFFDGPPGAQNFKPLPFQEQASIYTALWGSNNKEQMKRLLLAQCFKEILKVSITDSTNSSVMKKLENAVQGRSIYPQPYLVIR